MFNCIKTKVDIVKNKELTYLPGSYSNVSIATMHRHALHRVYSNVSIATLCTGMPC